MSLALLRIHSIMETGVMFALGRHIGIKLIKNARIVMKEQSIMFWMINVSAKIAPLIRLVIQNVLLAHHLNILTSNWSNVLVAWRKNSLIPRFSSAFAQQQAHSRPTSLVSAASYRNTLIILIRLARTVKKTMFTIPKSNNAEDAQRISRSLLMIDALLALINNFSI